MMQRLNFSIAIEAPAARVYDLMLAPQTYNEWAAEFDPTSTFEGGWGKGEKIRFTATDDKGRKGGMVARIEENLPAEFVSIQHYGVLDGDQEITEGEAVQGWAGAIENYRFSENSGITTLNVEVDTKEEYVDYFEQAWPKALAKLKEICER